MYRLDLINNTSSTFPYQNWLTWINQPFLMNQALPRRHSPRSTARCQSQPSRPLWPHAAHGGEEAAGFGVTTSKAKRRNRSTGGRAQEPWKKGEPRYWMLVFFVSYLSFRMPESSWPTSLSTKPLDEGHAVSGWKFKQSAGVHLWFFGLIRYTVLKSCLEECKKRVLSHLC